MFKGVGTLFIKELTNWRRIVWTFGLSILAAFLFVEVFAKNANLLEELKLLMGFGLSFVGFYLARLISYWIKQFLIKRPGVQGMIYRDPNADDTALN